VSNWVPLSHWNCGYESATQHRQAQISASECGYFMRLLVQSFIPRHSKSILTVSNEMMRQSMVRMPRRPCTEPIARLVRYILALMQTR